MAEKETKQNQSTEDKMQELFQLLDEKAAKGARTSPPRSPRWTPPR